MAKSKIQIKPSKKGTLHDALGVKRGSKIPASKLKIHEGDSPALKKKKQFAINARKWHHAQDGYKTLPTAYVSAPRPISGYMGNQQMQLQQNIAPDTNTDYYNQYANWDYIDIPDFPDDPSLYPPQQQDPQLAQRTSPNVNPGMPPFPQQKKPFQYDGKYGDMALAGLLAVDALIPNKKPKAPVVRPQLSYNEHPNGTGSSAIAEYGIKMSNSGYKANSPDKGFPSLRIPSNKITMKGVQFPVLGRDNTGHTKLMMPGAEYNFPGDYVDEIPMAQNGASIPRMDSAQISYFNNFLDYVKDRGYQGSTKLNTGTLNEDLYKDYQTANPNSNINLPLRDLTRMAQNEQHIQKAFDVDFVGRKNPQMKDAVANSSISKIDDFFGSETSKRYIPTATKIDKRNGNVTNVTNLGFVPNSINKASTLQTKKVPDGVEIIDTTDGRGYFDPQYGNFVKLRNGGKMSVFPEGPMGTYKKGTTHDLSPDEIKSLVASGYKLKFV
ncbi:MAG TPA: hypothetical protein PLS56_02670 [Candidatus Dojkabacteria bacterium]|nr:hypothetical protein [Candidatus Dojkabacteria bacterium]